MKCLTVSLQCKPSSWSRHAWQYSVSDLPILERYALRGTCPHLIWVIKLAWFLDKWWVRFRKLLNGKLSSITVILWYLSDFSQLFSHFSFSFLWNSCLVADALVGSGLLRMCGRLILLLELPPAASFARSSTFSLPFTLLWLEIQWIPRLHGSLLACEMRWRVRYCPDTALGLARDDITAWLSMYREKKCP